MNIWDEVVNGFNEEINNLRLTLSNGSAEDYSHYRQIVGSISSLEWARDNLTDIVKNVCIWRMTKEMQQVSMGGAIKNDLWITDVEEAPDPSPLPKIPGFHVLVRPVSVKA